MTKRKVITGMSVNTPLADTLPGFLTALIAGRSAITQWKQPEFSGILSKVGADLSDYDIERKFRSMEDRIPDDVKRRLKKFIYRAPWTTKLSGLLAADAFIDAGMFERPLDGASVATVVAGHNINLNYKHTNRQLFDEDIDSIDPLYGLLCLDTDHAGSISEILQLRGPTYTVGAACASGNLALRFALNEIEHHDVDAALVVGAVFDFSPVEVHGMAIMGAITCENFNDQPRAASRPFDVRREGFVPAHGGAVLVVESLDCALRRGAKIYAEILAVEASADGNHLPQPSEDGQYRLITSVLKNVGLAPEQIDYVNVHATSTPLGDLTEIRSLKRVFGSHSSRLKINATKSMVGHTCWSSATVEMVAAVLQMNAGELHPSINIENLDPEIDLDVCAGGSVKHRVEHFLKNSFGFGGLNCVAVLKRFEE